MKRLIIIGASGHGEVVADVAVLNGYNDIVFLDDDKRVIECCGFSVVGNSIDAPEGELFVAIGNQNIRKRLMEKYISRKQPVLIHPSAILSKKVEIGNGSVVMAGCVINPNVRIGKGCIINTMSSIDHDCIIDDYVHVSVGAHICGMVKIGESSWIGAGAVISNNINICSGCIIGAGGVVIKSIYEPGTYVGVPVRKIK